MPAVELHHQSPKTRLLKYEVIFGQVLNVRNYTQKDTLRFFGELAGVPTEMRPLYPEIGSHEAAIRHFVECVAEDREPTASGEQGLAVLRLIAAIYQSAATGREVVLAE